MSMHWFLKRSWFVLFCVLLEKEQPKPIFLSFICSFVHSLQPNVFAAIWNVWLTWLLNVRNIFYNYSWYFIVVILQFTNRIFFRVYFFSPRLKWWISYGLHKEWIARRFVVSLIALGEYARSSKQTSAKWVSFYCFNCQTINSIVHL